MNFEVSTWASKPAPAMHPGSGRSGPSGLATPSRHIEQAYLGSTWTRTSRRAGMNSSSRRSSSPIRVLGRPQQEQVLSV